MMQDSVIYILATIERELESGALENWHGINEDNISERLTNPKLEKYQDFSEKGSSDYWTVLEEFPELQTGYTIYFDQELDQFGLGMYVENGRRTALGIYGTFIKALNGM